MTHVSVRAGQWPSGPQAATPLPPLVSLCIPAYQAQRHLQATIDSVLAQTYPNLEIVIVDNSSTDATPEIVAAVDDPRVRVLRNAATVPMVDNFNLAIRASRGEFVKLVCADDVLDPECVAAQAAVLQAEPDVALVGVRTDFIDDEGRQLRRSRGLRGVLGRRPGETVVRRIVRSGSNPVGAPVAAMFRRTDFDRCGGFRDDLLYVMDMDLWVRLLQHGEFFGVPRTLASFRIASGSATALTSARSQFAQQTTFADMLVDDGRWNVSVLDRALGHVNSYDMQLRRTLLTQLSTFRAARRSAAKSRRRAYSHPQRIC